MGIWSSSASRDNDTLGGILTDSLLFEQLIPLWARQLWRKYMRNSRWGPWIGYLMGFLLVAMVSTLIGLIGPETRITDNSILYVLVVVILAAVFGRGPAVATVFMALVTYDFLFVPPRRVLSIATPRETLALTISVIIALITGQLTASLRARAHEARQRERESRILAQLVQVLAACDSLNDGLQQALKLMLQVFQNTRITFGAVLLPDKQDTLHVVAYESVAGVTIEPGSIFTEDALSQAQVALREARPIGYFPVLSGSDNTLRLLFPLRSGGQGQILGVIGVGGGNNLYRLIAPTPGIAPLSRRLLSAFVDQISLAIERDRLRQEAVHASALRESDQMKTALLGSVTHDLRTPLASIKAAATSLLEPETQWDEGGRRVLLQNINEAADRLNRLVGNLLELSRLEAGGLRPCKEWQDIGDVIATTLDQLETSALTAQHHIQVDIVTPLPPVLCDYGQIEQVLSNLLINACKYSPPGTTITVTACLNAQGDLEVRVRDQGIGIPAAFHTAIFEKFYRLPQQPPPDWASNRTFEGTGLGLAICKGIIEMHDGHIWVESAPGQGATFIFTLPIAAGDPPYCQSVSASEIPADLLR